MTDRKLLELAAKAAGLNIKTCRVDGDDTFTHLVVGARNTKERTDWNPLADDGDALRLAMKLKMSIEIHYTEGEPDHPWLRIVYTRARRWEHVFADDYLRDPCAATCRAIVRAAAEIGKAMK